jgi:Glycosyl transferases group 1
MTDQYAYISGSMDSSAMAEWYNALDLLTNCSYAEGFGIPILEAQACGTPVVVTNGSAMTELCGSGWTVDGDFFWSEWHHAEWVRPPVPKILAAYEKAYQVRGSRTPRDRAFRFAQQYEYNLVARECWKPFLETVEMTSKEDAVTSSAS